jgi:hypothetical protein
MRGKISDPGARLVAVPRARADSVHRGRLRALIVVLWRAKDASQ